MKAMLFGQEPPVDLGYEYGGQPPYEAVVIGSLTLSQVLHFREEPILEALAQGKQVLLYSPGLPQVKNNRALGASLASACRELKTWGVVFTEGRRKALITAREAEAMRRRGQLPGPGDRLTPLAREILEGST